MTLVICVKRRELYVCARYKNSSFFSIVIVTVCLTYIMIIRMVNHSLRFSSIVIVHYEFDLYMVIGMVKKLSFFINRDIMHCDFCRYYDK